MRHAIFTVTISTVSDTFLPLKSLFTFLLLYRFTFLPFKRNSHIRNSMMRICATITRTNMPKGYTAA